MEKVKGKSELSFRLVEFSDKAGPSAKVGFVPTMGALHAGHLSLMERARATCDVVVVSVFVNPTQFNDPKDLAHYPRTPDADATWVERAGADVLWMPEVEDVYEGEAVRPKVLLGACTAVLEAARRPGHFDGVIAVVDRLCGAVQPDVLFLGEKDLQQVAVLRAWARVARPALEVVVCPTARDVDGLALSSRNARLSAEGRRVALQLPAALLRCAERVRAGAELQAEVQAVRTALGSTAGMTCEYVEAVDPDTFESVEARGTGPVYAVAAVVVEGVRLIDNVRLA